MISFIPLDLYHDVIKVLTLLCITILCSIALANKRAVISPYRNRNQTIIFCGWIYFLILFILISLRPISYAFGDMGNYYKHFLEYQSGGTLKKGDYLFELLMLFSAHYLTAEIFFFICASLHLIPILIACIRIFKRYWPLAFFFIIAHYDFYGFAVNGIRNGIGTSVFMLALTYTSPFNWLLILSATGFHSSLALPAAAYVLTQFYLNPKHYLYAWFACLGISAVYSGFGEFISSLGFFSDKLDIYLNLDDEAKGQFSAVGFRVDFLLYSALPVFIGWYFIIEKKIAEPFYTKLFCIYLTCNAFWILVIRIPSSNRFAYLSWFMMGLIIAYPFIKFYVLRYQHMFFSALLFSFYLFTFISH